MQTPKLKRLHRFAFCWAFFSPVYFLAAAAMDPSEVTNGEYLKFVLATRHAPPEYWINGRYPAGKENEPVVLVNFHDVNAYCRTCDRADIDRPTHGRPRSCRVVWLSCAH